MLTRDALVVAAIIGVALPAAPDPKHVTIDTTAIWPLAGIMEELRNHGVALPARAEEIITEALVKINVPVFVRETYPERGAELVEILEALDIPDALPDVYPKGYTHPVTVDSGGLGLFEAREFLRDRVLGVGLKSYPYVVDWNADGKKDLLVGDHDGFIYLYLNEGSNEAPVFGEAERVKAVDTDAPLVIQLNPKMGLADFRGIGVKDLVLGNYGARVAYLPNRATDGTFAFAVEDLHYLRCESGDIDVGNYAYPEAVDWNNDGFADLLVGQVEGRVILFLNQCRRGEAVFHDGVELEGIEPVMYPHPVVVDWNGDGKKDLILGHREGTVQVYLNVGADEAPRLERAGVAEHPDGRPVSVALLSHPCVSDWDEDGRPDLLIGNDSGQVLLFRNVGSRTTPAFAEGQLLKDGGGELICGVHPVFAPVDWDGDGRLDILVGHEEAELRLFRNLGSREKPDFDSFEIVAGINMRPEVMADEETAPYWNLAGLEFDTEYLGNLAPRPVDWNDSGKLDLLVGNYTGLIYLFRNTGTREEPRYEQGEPLRYRDGRLLRVAGFSTPIVVDWNGDGKRDLVSGDLLGRVHVFLNVGSDDDPAFAEDLLVTIEGEPLALGPRCIVEVTDLTGDGRKDVLVGNRFGGVFALINEGTETEPAFKAVERLLDKSLIWRSLYDGAQYSSSGRWDTFPEEGKPKPMFMVETSCPRAVDWDGDGRDELLISQRYGRIFVFRQVPRR